MQLTQGHFNTMLGTDPSVLRNAYRVDATGHSILLGVSKMEVRLRLPAGNYSELSARRVWLPAQSGAE